VCVNEFGGTDFEVVCQLPIVRHEMYLFTDLVKLISVMSCTNLFETYTEIRFHNSHVGSSFIMLFCSIDTS